ncbi:MAG: GNAT family N-acetyltransferase [Pseudomonadota bacterium]
MTDAATLNALHVSAFGHAGAHGWREADFARALEDPAFALATSPDGYAIARLVLDEAELLLIATRPEARRSGVATALLSDLEARLVARGVTRLMLEVMEANVAASAFYEARGFREAGRRAGYYGRGAGHDARLFEKALKS